MRSLLSAFLIFVLSSSAIAADGDFGVWYGSMDAGVREFRFRIESSAAANDSRPARQLVSLDEGGQIFQLDDFTLDDSSLTFVLKASKAAYSGSRSDDGNTITGKWKQAGTEFDLVLKHYEKSPEDVPAEIWTGSISTLFQKLALRVRVYIDEDGGEQVRFDSVSQKAGGFKAKRKTEGHQWTIDVASLGGVFKGVVNSDSSEVKGTWAQGGAILDLTLTRGISVVPEVVAAVVRPQTPKPPFPYLVESVSFENSSEKVTLAGTLTLPHSDAPCSAVILISGSGPQDRNESLLDHVPFWVIADHLTRSGIAVLRFDDRGTAQSTGDFATATSENFANDAEAALEFLLKDKRIDPHRIGMIGHSEGGLIAPIIASRRRDVAFVVLLAGTGVNGREILLSQGQLILKAEGVTDEVSLNAQKNAQTAMMEAAASTAFGDAAEQQIKATLEKLASQLPAEATKAGNLKQTLDAGITQLRTPWFRYFLTHEPGPVLEKVTCPVLALNGEKDVQVDPRLNLSAIQAALEKGGNLRFETVELPGLNHLFQTCTTGGVSEYHVIKETISPLALERMTSWILAVVSL